MRILLALVVAALAAAATMPTVAGEACVPSCAVPSTLAAFAPPVVAIASGSTLTWSSLDVPHTASAEGDLCFHVAYTRSTSGSARFDVLGGALHAQALGKTAERCDDARALPDGSFALDYVCLYHPNMKGTILVK